MRWSMNGVTPRRTWKGNLPSVGRLPGLGLFGERTHKLVFYKGEIGRAIDAEMKARGGFLALSDLAADRAEWWEPIHVSYRGHEVMTTPPPSNAFPSLIRLGILSRFDVARLGHNSADYLHTLVEGAKLAFADRERWYGDPAFGDVPLDRLLSSEYAALRRALIDPAVASEDLRPGGPSRR